MEEATLTISDYWRVLKRRRWNMFFTFIGIMILSLLVAFGLPAQYRSSALIMIEGQDIPEDLVRSTVTSFADERVQRITQRAMTSINLSRIIDEHDLYSSRIERVPRSEIIEEMREDITIDLVAADVIDPRSGRPTKATIAFSIAFDYSEPVDAQKVANQLVSLYREVNLQEGESQVEGAADFLQELADNHRDQVLALESQLAELKLKSNGAQPEFLSSNMQLLARMESDLAATEAKLQAIKSRIIILEAQLLQTDPDLPGSLDGGGAATPEQALAILESELRIARSQYGSEHPSVRQYKRMVEELRRDGGSAGTSDVSVIDGEIADAETQLELARGRYGEEHPEIVALKRRIANLRNSRVRSLETILNGTVTPSDAVVSEINIREGPGTDTPVIGTLSREERATLVDSGNDQWFKIATDGGLQGYVSRSVSVSEAPQPIAPPDGTPAVETQNIPSNPAYITLRANLMQAQSEAEGLLALYRNLQTKVEEKQDVIERTPMVERTYSAVLRELTAARMRLEESSAKAEEARVGVKIVKDGKAQAFNLLEPPIAATQPHWPNRWALVFLGFVLSILGTLAAAALAENVDDSVRSASDVAELGGGPPLAMIPVIENSRDTSESRKGFALVAMAAAGVVLLLLAAVHFLYRPLDVVWYLLLRKVGL